MMIAVVGFTTVSFAQSSNDWVEFVSDPLTDQSWTNSSKTYHFEINDPYYCGFPEASSGYLTAKNGGSFLRSEISGVTGICFPVFNNNGKPAEYFAVKEYLTPGTYKFSYRFKKSSTNPADDLAFFYTNNLNGEKHIVKELNGINTSKTNTYTTDEFEITESGYYFMGFYGSKNPSNVETYFLDFRMYRKGGAPTIPAYNVNLNVEGNGTVIVKKGDNTISLPTEVEENTVLTIETMAGADYELTALTVNDTDIMQSKEFTVTSETTIKAVFSKTEEPAEKYTQEFGQGYGDGRYWTNTKFTTTTDGTKTIGVNFTASSSKYDIYSDKLVTEENTVTVYKNETFDLRINGSINWIYSAVYIDWNGDGDFEDANENIGLAPEPEHFNEGVIGNSAYREYSINVPDNATVGDTRVRIILGFMRESENKYLTSTNIDDKKNAMARDFALRIMDDNISPRTVTVLVNNEAMGKAVITGTEDKSVTTSDLNVSVTAIPGDGYMFVNWTNAEGAEVSSENPYIYNGLEDITLTANFTEKVYPVMKRKYTTLNQQNRYLKEVIANVAGEAQTVFSAASQEELPVTPYLNEGVFTEEGALIDKTANQILLTEGTTEFDMTFKVWTEVFSVNGETCSQQLVWTSQAIYVDWNNDKDFDDANECLGAVGTPATENNFGDTNGSLANGWTRKITVPADVKTGTYRMRVVYNESSAAGWDKTFFAGNKGELNAGVSYDFDIRIEEHAETWTEVHFNSLSGSKANEINLNNDPYYISPEQTGTNNWNTSNASGASETANKYGPYIKDVAEGYYLAYKYDVEKSATYRFSFLHKKAETVETTAKLCYTTSLSEAFIDASDVVALEKKNGNESGVLFQSNNIELEKGSYYFVYYIVSGGTSKVRIADFKLEMLDGSEVESTPKYNITVKKPANGNLLIDYTDNEGPQTIETSSITGESQVYNIPENTVLYITVTPEQDYELDQLLPTEGMEEKTGLTGDTYYVYTVTGDATIEATFKAIQYGQVSVTAPDETQGSIEIQLESPRGWVTADDFYLAAVEFDTKLRANVTAKTGYTVKSVMKNGTAIDKDADGYYYFTVDAEEITISAEFEKEVQDGYLITITNPAEGGTIKVMNGETEVTNNSRVPENTTVTIIPEAAPGYTTQKVLANGKIVTPRLVDGKPVYEKSITEDTEFTVEFKVMEYEINWVDPKNGTLKLYNSNNLEQELVKGTKVPAGTKITVVPDANDNYIFTRTYYTLGSKEVEITEGENGFEFTVTPDSENPYNTVFYVYAEFEPETYTLETVVTPEEGGSVSVTVDYKPVKETVKYGDVITVTVKENPGYIHESTVVEGAEEIDGQAGKYTVKEAVTITVTFKKDTSSINSVENGTVYYNAVEEVLYTGNAASVRVYDLSGRLVLNAENQATVSLAELADGVYTAVVDGKVLKLNK